MAVNLSPVGGVAGQFFDNNGNPLTGGKIFTYAAGTTTNQATYTTASGGTAHTNPIILDSAGRVPSGEIWLTDGLAYKFIIKDSTDVLIGTYDGVSGINSNFVNFTNQQEIQTATAGQTVFTLTTMQYQPSTNSLSVFVDGVNQYGPGASYAYVETDSTTVTFTIGLHAGAEVKFTTSNLNSSAGSDAFNVSYTPPFTGSVGTNVGDKLAQTVSVKDFGAVGDGVADDTAAIQAAINAMVGIGRGVVYVPPGTYRTTSTITLFGLSVSLEGSGSELCTILKADFIGGAVLKVQNRRNSVKNLQIDSFASRISGGGTSDIGVFVDPGDVGTNRVTHAVFENLFISNQPSHGFVHIGATWDCLYSRIICKDCGGHGFVFDNGSSFGYSTNLQLPGICRMEFCEGADNDGHGLLIGNDNSSANRGLRFVIVSCDFYRCAESTGIRKAATNVWVFGELCEINSCGINGLNKAGTTAVNALIYVFGRSNAITGCRLLDSANPSAIYVGGTIDGYDTNGLVVERCQLIDSLGSMLLNPVVNIDANARNVSVLFYNTNEIQGVKTLTANNAQFANVQTVYQLSDQIVNNSTTLVSSSGLTIPLFAYQRATFKAQLFFTGDVTADIRFAVLYPSGATCWYTTTNNLRLNSSDVVSGNDVQTAGGLFTVGSAGTTTRVCEISGFIETNGTAGNLTIRFAQGSAVVADTTLKANSSLTLITA